MSTTDGFISRVLDETREEIIRADGKASIILASAGVAVGAILAGMIAGDVTLAGQPGGVWTLTVLSAVLVAAGLVEIAWAVYPRVGDPVAGRARYFSEIQTYKDRAVLASALQNESVNAGDRDLDQLWDLSRIVWKKYERTRRAMWLLGLGFVAAGLAALIGTGAGP